MSSIAKSPRERRPAADESAAARRNKAPVFVLGCPRSGTTLLYHMLLSAGDFAVYRAESNVFNLLAPRFGGMGSEADREELLKVWLRSKLFRVSGLKADEISHRILTECRGGGDFLRIVMEEVACQQGVRRWADCTPDHLLYMEEIKRHIPDALFIHIIRDGRDVALSYVQQRWSHPLPWDLDESLAVAGLYWEWAVGKGREQGKLLGADYQEVRFEELIADPQKTLARLGLFIDHDLDYDRIQRAAIGSVHQPNSSFGDTSEGSFNPVARWKTKMSAEQIAAFENLVGASLLDLGYGLHSAATPARTLRTARLRTTYRAMFEAKHWMKATPLGRFISLGCIQIEPDAG